MILKIWKHPQNLIFQGKRIHLKMLFRVWTLKILVWTILGGDDSKQHIHGHGPQLQSRPFYDFASLWNVFFWVFSKRYMFFFRKSHLSSFSVSQEVPSENTRSGMRQPAEELDPKSGNSSRTIILTVVGSKDWRLSPTSAALYKSKQDKS